MVGSIPLTIIVTTFQEEQTLPRALDALLAQPLPERSEVLVVGPDDATAAVAARYAALDARIRHLRDKGQGKPAALNLAFAEARGEFAVLTDGDVYLGPGALLELLAPFRDIHVGAVSGRPHSLNPRDNMLGYWSHLLVEQAHQLRLFKARRGEYCECSGYLYAVRRSLVQPIPEDTLVEDGIVSFQVWKQGCCIAYAPEAAVYCRFPATWADWLRQKVRTTAGYQQPYFRKAPRVRSLREEMVQGTRRTLQFARTPREFLWSLALLPARLYVWLYSAWRLWRSRSGKGLWQRVESTKRVE